MHQNRAHPASPMVHIAASIEDISKIPKRGQRRGLVHGREIPSRARRSANWVDYVKLYALCYLTIGNVIEFKSRGMVVAGL